MDKVCTKCSELKTLDEFSKQRRNTKGGVRTRCKVCTREDSAIYREKNREILREKGRQHMRKTRVERTLYAREYYHRNIDKMRRWGREYSRNKRKNDIAYRLRKNLRNRVWHFLNGNTKSKSTRELLGCDFKILKQHLERQFKHNMSWDGYGTVWEIDHVVPLSSVDRNDLAFETELQKLCHYSNLQPLFVSKNRSKGNKWGIL